MNITGLVGQLPSAEAGGVAEAAAEETRLKEVWLAISVVLVAAVALMGDRAVKRFPWLSLASFACGVGLLGGLGLLSVGALHLGGVKELDVDKLLEFDPLIFFHLFLPPIIFHAGVAVKKKNFFRNAGTILGLGLLGTFVSFAIIGGLTYLVFGLAGTLTKTDCMAIGAMMSATDSVSVLQIIDQGREPLLHSLVFGEGVINDAVSIVLLRAVQANTHGEGEDVRNDGVFSVLGSFVGMFVASTFVGLFFGLLSAYMMNRKARLAGHRAESFVSAVHASVIHAPQQSVAHQVMFVFMLAYLSYMSGEAMELSGIMTLFLTGLTMSHYTLYNLEPKAQCTTWFSIEMASELAELTIFLFIGMDSIQPGNWNGANGLTIVLLFLVYLFAIFLARACFVFPICYLRNRRAAEARKVPVREQILIFWSGTIRGSVSVALVFNQFAPRGSTVANGHDTNIVGSVVLLVLFSTIVMGSLNQKLVAFLNGRYGAHPMPDVGRATLELASLPEVAGEEIYGEEDGLASPRSGSQTPGSSRRRASVPEGLEDGEISPFLEHADRHRYESERGIRSFREADPPAPRTPSLGIFQPIHESPGAGPPPRGLALVWRNFDNNVMKPLFGGREAAAP